MESLILNDIIEYVCGLGYEFLAEQFAEDFLWNIEDVLDVYNKHKDLINSLF